MQTKNEVLLEQTAYTKALLSRFGMDKANSVATPVDINADPVTTSDEVEECDRLIPKCCRHCTAIQLVRAALKRTPEEKSGYRQSAVRLHPRQHQKRQLQG
ncbi:hypothetical protein FHG87_006396 [Trinorchestia longiramus]|nr:hypothetical protein FHG87_006396 [Trinorchestia longiramus]